MALGGGDMQYSDDVIKALAAVWQASYICSLIYFAKLTFKRANKLSGTEPAAYRAIQHCGAWVERKQAERILLLPGVERK